MRCRVPCAIAAPVQPDAAISSGWGGAHGCERRRATGVTPTLILNFRNMWDGKVTRPGDEPETLPYYPLIGEGRYAGGHALMLHADGNTYLFAVRPEVILLLRGMLPDDQYRLHYVRDVTMGEDAGR